MKLRNKETGEIVEDAYVRETHDFQFDGQKHVLAVFKGNGHRPPERISGPYYSLAELNAEWEDYEESREYWYMKEYWYINSLGQVIGTVMQSDDDKVFADELREFGNYFETKEEVERAVEKLKAFNRLKDKGFRFSDYHIGAGEIHFDITISREILDDFNEDMSICFGGED